MTPSGIDPATFQFVALCLNHCVTACPDLSVLLQLYLVFVKNGGLLLKYKSHLQCLGYKLDNSHYAMPVTAVAQASATQPYFPRIPFSRTKH
jgi:hypothetical protein